MDQRQIKLPIALNSCELTIWSFPTLYRAQWDEQWQTHGQKLCCKHCRRDNRKSMVQWNSKPLKILKMQMISWVTEGVQETTKNCPKKGYKIKNLQDYPNQQLWNTWPQDKACWQKELPSMQWRWVQIQLHFKEWITKHYLSWHVVSPLW